MARLTHNEHNNAGIADRSVHDLLSKLFHKNLLSNTILILFSDHGIRFGDLRETMSGRTEERLPFIFIHLPDESKNPDWIENLQINKHRLTSPFDIHSTLMHLVNGHPNEKFPFGMTLFQEIPESRTCASAGISDHWCVCQSVKQLDDLTLLNTEAQFIIEQINRMFVPLSDKCARLELDQIIRAFEYETNNELTDYEFKQYLITLRAKPSAALLEATVKTQLNNSSKKLIGDVSRLNFYGPQSKCIDNAYLQKYCFCKY